MSLWQLSACVDGWNRSQGGEEPIEAMNSEDFDAMIARHQDWILSSGTATKQ